MRQNVTRATSENGEVMLIPLPFVRLLNPMTTLKLLYSRSQDTICLKPTCDSWCPTLWIKMESSALFQSGLSTKQSSISTFPLFFH